MMQMPKKHRREPIELQLTAMIDIFAMLIIFLIKGTVFGNVDVHFPETLALPKSVSKESVEPGPEVIIEGDQVQVTFLNQNIRLAAFQDPTGSSPEIIKLHQQLRNSLTTPSPKGKHKSKTLNFVADRETPYNQLFDVMKVFRESGYESVLLIATGNSDGQK